MKPMAREILVPASSAVSPQILVPGDSAPLDEFEIREQSISRPEARGAGNDPSIVVDRQLFEILSTAVANSPLRNLHELIPPP